jgi:hypothetical protein
MKSREKRKREVTCKFSEIKKRNAEEEKLFKVIRGCSHVMLQHFTLFFALFIYTLNQTLITYSNI